MPEERDPLLGREAVLDGAAAQFGSAVEPFDEFGLAKDRHDLVGIPSNPICVFESHAGHTTPGGGTFVGVGVNSGSTRRTTANRRLAARPVDRVPCHPMNLTQLTSADLKQIVKLIERKETLQRRVAKIDAQLAAYEGGEPAKAVKGKTGRKPRGQTQAKPAGAKRVKRGALKAAIIELLRAAGKSGLAVKELAGKLGLGYKGVLAWFYKTGANIEEIKKAGPGKYAWIEKK